MTDQKFFKGDELGRLRSEVPPEGSRGP